LKDQVEALGAEDFPPVPWMLNGHTRIHDTGNWLEALRRNVAQGPSGPKAYMGTLWVELADAARVLEEEKARRAQKV
jgi:hypothetical protein